MSETVQDGARGGSLDEAHRAPSRAVAAALGRALLTLASTVVPVMFGVVTGVFFLLRLVPGDPAVMILGDRASPEALHALREKLGLDLPLWQQYLDFWGDIFTRGDTGDSLATGVATGDLIASRAPISLGIVALAIVFALVITVPLALAAVRRKDGPIDQLVRVLPTISMGMPVFWIGLLLIIVFAVQLRLFPVGGVSGSGALAVIHSLALPSLTLALAMSPPLIRSLRAQLLEVMEADFVTTLRAARVPERTIRWRHVLRGAALPTLGLMSVNVAYLIGGTLVIEKVFGINGLGTMLFQAISTRDFPVVQAVALYCALVVVIVSFAAEFLAALLDPRLRRRRR